MIAHAIRRQPPKQPSPSSPTRHSTPISSNTSSRDTTSPLHVPPVQPAPSILLLPTPHPSPPRNLRSHPSDHLLRQPPLPKYLLLIPSLILTSNIPFQLLDIPSWHLIQSFPCFHTIPQPGTKPSSPLALIKIIPQLLLVPVVPLMIVAVTVTVTLVPLVKVPAPMLLLLMTPTISGGGSGQPPDTPGFKGAWDDYGNRHPDGGGGGFYADIVKARDIKPKSVWEVRESIEFQK